MLFQHLNLSYITKLIWLWKYHSIWISSLCLSDNVFKMQLFFEKLIGRKNYDIIDFRHLNLIISILVKCDIFATLIFVLNEWKQRVWVLSEGAFSIHVLFSCVYIFTYVSCRDGGGGRAVMRRAAGSAPGAVFWSAKIWEGVFPPAPAFPVSPYLSVVEYRKRTWIEVKNCL